ncbi:MAG: hypothetical protein IJK40_00690, partial [Clostridia bacterium]|nr:hypothetical protein [Clostridia bacterium]
EPPAEEAEEPEAPAETETEGEPLPDASEEEAEPEGDAFDFEDLDADSPDETPEFTIDTGSSANPRQEKVDAFVLEEVKDDFDGINADTEDFTAGMEDISDGKTVDFAADMASAFGEAPRRKEAPEDYIAALDEAFGDADDLPDDPESVSVDADGFDLDFSMFGAEKPVNVPETAETAEGPAQEPSGDEPSKKHKKKKKHNKRK